MRELDVPLDDVVLVNPTLDLSPEWIARIRALLDDAAEESA